MKARALIRNGTARLKDSPAIDHWQKGREKIEAEILLIDLWAREPNQPYADQTWMASLGAPAG